MHTHFIEVEDNIQFNYGKFMLARFDTAEWLYKSVIDPGYNLIAGRGWSPEHLLVLDLQTGEGAIFLPGGMAEADLNQKHQIWVCPLFEPFLNWLYKQDVTLENFNKLPAMVTLSEGVEPAFAGYRRYGITEQKLRGLFDLLYDQIKHGDKAHQEWLRKKFTDFADDIVITTER